MKHTFLKLKRESEKSLTCYRREKNDSTFLYNSNESPQARKEKSLLREEVVSKSIIFTLPS